MTDVLTVHIAIHPRDKQQLVRRNCCSGQVSEQIVNILQKPRVITSIIPRTANMEKRSQV